MNGVLTSFTNEALWFLVGIKDGHVSGFSIPLTLDEMPKEQISEDDRLRLILVHVSGVKLGFHSRGSRRDPT